MGDNYDVISERIAGLKVWLNEKFNENEASHKKIMSRQDMLDENQKKTNGNVKKLNLWKSAILGGFTVLAFIVGSSGLPKFLQFLGFSDKQNIEIPQEVLDEWKEEIILRTQANIMDNIKNGNLELKKIE